MEQAKLGAQQWKSAQESLLHLEKSNVASVDEIVRSVIKIQDPNSNLLFAFCSSNVYTVLCRGGMDTIEILRGRFSSAVSSALEDTHTGSKNLLSSIDRKPSTFRSLWHWSERE